MYLILLKISFTEKKCRNKSIEVIEFIVPVYVRSWYSSYLFNLTKSDLPENILLIFICTLF